MKKITLKKFEVKSFVTSLREEKSLTVKGGVSALPDCEEVGQPTDCNCNPTQTQTTLNRLSVLFLILRFIAMEEMGPLYALTNN